MPVDNQAAMKALTDPHRLFTRAQVLTQPCPVPASRGVYAWYFREIPGDVPTEGCVTKDGLTLLYVGISPKNDHSSQNLRKRITYHYKGNAEGSTVKRRPIGTPYRRAKGTPLALRYAVARRRSA